MAVINGSAANDTLVGGDASDFMYGLEGDDHLSGAAGNDALTGGPGNDTIDGGEGDDTLFFSGNFADYSVVYDGAAGRFTFTDLNAMRDGVDAVRNVERFQFNDVGKTALQLGGGTASDTMPPLLIGTNPLDGSTGVAIDANLVGTFSEPVLRGSGTIVLRSADGVVFESYDVATSPNISIDGNVVTVNPSANLARGTLYTLSAPAGVFKDAAGNPTDSTDPGLTFATAGAAQTGGAGNDRLTGSVGDDLIDGASGDDEIDGGAGNDRLAGGAGNDVLIGGSGDDTLDGGNGRDRMEGGQGADLYYVDNLGDLVVELDNAISLAPALRPGLDLGQTLDKVVSSVSYSLTSFVENLELAAGGGNLSGVGNSLDNILTGNEGNNSFTGGAGNDLIDGQAGLDSALFAGPRADYSVSPGGSATTVQANAGTDGTDTLINIERLRFADLGIALDTGASQSGGGTALLIGAVLGQAALAAKKPLVGAVLDLFDQGYSLQILSGAVMRLDIWGLLANGGAASASNTQIASYLLRTVNGTAPDTATLNAAVAALDSETGAAQGSFLWHLAESAANQTQVNLVGLAQTGLDYQA